MSHRRKRHIVRVGPAVAAAIVLLACAGCTYAIEGVWRERGFSDFADGAFGNAGQNLYVSRAGVLQRIFQFDLNQDGFFDLVVCNSHGKDEQLACWPNRAGELFRNSLHASAGVLRASFPLV